MSALGIKDTENRGEGIDMVKIAIGIIIVLALLLIFISVVDMVLVGVVSIYFSIKRSPKKAMVKNINRIDFQEANECSGYSVAYVLRNFGIEADGLELYNNMPNKMENGYVYPKEIKYMLERYGIKTRFSITSLNALKCEIAKGNPVIVLIRLQPGEPWLHYVSVVGYDTENIYLAESLMEFVNVEGETYNRRLSKKEFLKLWNTSMIKMPLYRHIMYSKKL